ncbi:transcriptional regulator [Mesorhizobium loti]|nr:dimethylsulfonioproprionate lyase family protein [Mesorhizobium loti]PLP58397.1 transcriptional regulator [Mesorhizobium loti]
MAASNQEKLVNFLDDLAAAIGPKAVGDTPLARGWQRVADSIPRGEIETGPAQPARRPACIHLAAGYRNLENAGSHLSRLAVSFQAIEPLLDWTSREERRDSDALAQNYAGATIVGRDGVIASEHVEIGASILSPNTVYPNHRHSPEEVYIALSEGHWRQDDDPWVEPGIGGLIHNPANIVHAMRSGDQPLFAIWCLPLP